MYDTAWWGWLVWLWEAAVYNPLLDLGAWGLPLAALGALAYLTRRWHWPRLAGWWGARGGGGSGGGGRTPPAAGGGSVLWRWLRGRRRGDPHDKQQLDRDLDV